MARPIQKPLRVFQDILAYDFYIDKLYRITVVFVVVSLSRITAWLDRYVVDGFVNAVGLASVLGGESLKYSASGQSQFYMLTILLGVGALGLFLTWSLW
jgi:NAD(P)H-quinone oxidoreductase subunit 5